MDWKENFKKALEKDDLNNLEKIKVMVIQEINKRKKK